MQLLHQHLKRHILVGIRLQRHLAHALQELAERRPAGQVSAQDQRIHEKADELLNSRMVAIRDG